MFTTLVSVTDLTAHLDDPDWLVFDCRHDLADTEAGRRAYAQSHIPGARFVHLDDDLSGPKTGTNGRHPLPDPGKFCARLAALGMRDDTQAVAYDASGGFFAARLWWMLRWVGHTRAAVLDGGWDAWLKTGIAGHRAITGTENRRVQRHCARYYGRCALHIEPASVNRTTSSSTRAVPTAFAAKMRRSIQSAGTSPVRSTVSLKIILPQTGASNRRPICAREFAELLGVAEPAHVVHQCGSGVTACHNLLAMEIAGLHGSRLYPGSWSEWCSDPQRPVAR